MFKHILILVLLTIALYASNYEKGDEAYEDGDIKTAVSFWEKGVKKGRSRITVYAWVFISTWRSYYTRH